MLQRDPQFVPALLFQARLRLLGGDAAGALRSAQAAMSADPNSVESHYLVGVLHRRRGERPEAIAAFNDVLKLNPLVASAQVQLAELTLASGRGDLAVAHARDAVQAVPS